MAGTSIPWTITSIPRGREENTRIIEWMDPGQDNLDTHEFTAARISISLLLEDKSE